MSILDALRRGWWSGLSELPETLAGGTGLLENLIPGEQESLTEFERKMNEEAEKWRSKGGGGESKGILEKIAEGLGAAPGTIASMAAPLAATAAAPGIAAPALGFGLYGAIRHGDEGLAQAAGQGLKGLAEGALFGAAGAAAGKFLGKEAKALLDKQSFLYRKGSKEATAQADALEPLIKAALNKGSVNLQRRGLHAAGAGGITGAMTAIHGGSLEDAAASAGTMGILGMLGGMTPKSIAEAGKYRDPFAAAKPELDKLEGESIVAGEALRAKRVKEAEERLAPKVKDQDPWTLVSRKKYDGEFGNNRHITMNERAYYPTEEIAKIPGSKGEVRGQHRNKMGGDWESFKEDISRNGIRDPIFITVDSNGPRIVEGNHRIDAAVELGMRSVPVDIRYFGKSEETSYAIKPRPFGEGKERLLSRKLARMWESGTKKDEGEQVVGPELVEGTVPASDFGAIGQRTKGLKQETESFQEKLKDFTGPMLEAIDRFYKDKEPYQPKPASEGATEAVNYIVRDKDGKLQFPADKLQGAVRYMDDLQKHHEQKLIDLDLMLERAKKEGNEIDIAKYTEAKEAELLHTVADFGQFKGLRSTLGISMRELRGTKRGTPEWLSKAQDVKKKLGRDADRVIKMLEMSQDRPDLMVRIHDAVNQPKMWDMFQEAWISGLLSGLPTHAVNATSNALRSAIGVAESAAALKWMQLRGYEVRDPKTGDVKRVKLSKDEFVGEMAADLTAANDALKYAWKAFKGSLASEDFKPSSLDPSFSVYEKTQKLDYPTKAIPGKTGEVIRYPGRALMGMDLYFKIINGARAGAAKAYQMASEAIRKKEITEAQRAEYMAKLRGAGGKAHPEILKAMKQAGEAATFTEKLPKELAPIEKLRQVELLGTKPIMTTIPFLATPFNVIKQAVMRSPLGLAWWSKINKDYKSGKITAREMYQQKAGMVLGTTVFTSILISAKAGLVTGGGPADQQERQNQIAQGWRPYSVHIPGVGYIPLQRIEPLGTILGMAADINEFGDAEDKTGKAISIIKDNLANKSFLYGIESLAKAWAEPKQFGSIWYRQMAGSLVPAVVGRAQQAIDPIAREADTTGAMLGIPDPIAARIPGLSNALPQRSTAFGEPQERWASLGTENMAQRIAGGIQTFAAPVQVSIERKNTEVEKEFQRLSGFQGMPPSTPRRELKTTLRGVSGEKVKLSESEFQVYDKYHQMAKQKIAQIIKSPNYQMMKDEQKAKLLDSVYSRYRDIARKQIVMLVRKRSTVGD